MDRSLSESLFARAQQLMPGGVNSPARAFGAVGGTPIIFERADQMMPLVETYGLFG